ncbi:MAG TPA: hypothetical protein PKD45_01865 [Flavobacteriales bacterium]|nr:hypothetical protein [Flavobacteriales bacterium]
MMRSAWNTRITAMALFALLLMVTGCAKEEVVRPDAAMPVKAVTVDPGTSTDDKGISAPISDDGDDLGDKERSSRPKH